jgi:hypothetical protein
VCWLPALWRVRLPENLGFEDALGCSNLCNFHCISDVFELLPEKHIKSKSINPLRQFLSIVPFLEFRFANGTSFRPFQQTSPIEWGFTIELSGWSERIGLVTATLAVDPLRPPCCPGSRVGNPPGNPAIVNSVTWPGQVTMLAGN